MQNQTTFNFLIWEDGNLPIEFPNEMVELSKKLITKDYEWHTKGFPVHGAKYSLNGNQLWLVEKPNGAITITQDEFTGEAFIGTYFENSDETESNFFVCFKLIFLKGILQEIKFEESQREDPKVHKEYIKKYDETVAKRIRRQSSWWYRFLYYPYKLLIETFFIILINILSLVGFLLGLLCRLLAPI